MSEAENIARKVLNKRAKEGWSQAKIAEACDLSERYYGEIERCHANPTLNTLKKISTVLETTVAELVADPEEGSTC